MKITVLLFGEIVKLEGEIVENFKSLRKWIQFQNGFNVNMQKETHLEGNVSTLNYDYAQ